MAIATKLGLREHGHPVSLEDFEAAEFEEGYKYELIDGRLYVSPNPNLPEDRIASWLYEKMVAYKIGHPEIVKYLSTKSRVFVPGRTATTCPEPDLSLYRVFPSDLPLSEVRWQEVSPALVVEVLLDSDPHKDLVRNVELYLRVPSIREYWLFDARFTPDEPTLIVRRRRGAKWVVREYAAGEEYQTKLLPGFSLVVDPRQ
jgi:Uma2 family endonuclease